MKISRRVAGLQGLQCKKYKKYTYLCKSGPENTAASCMSFIKKNFINVGP